jgi:ankyrin repeat protein
MANGLALCIAVLDLDVEAVRTLISEGADCNYLHGCRTPLNILCSTYTSDNPSYLSDQIYCIFKLLVDGGADVFYQRQIDSLYMHWISAENGNLTTCELLLEKIPKDSLEKYTTSSTGASSLYVAAQNGHVAVVNHCLSNGFDVNNTTLYGITPLIAAVSDVKNKADPKKVLKIVKLLIRRGANLLHEYQGETALERTKDYFYNVKAQLIRAYTKQGIEVTENFVRKFIKQLRTSSIESYQYTIFNLLMVNKLKAFSKHADDLLSRMRIIETVQLLLLAGSKHKLNERCCAEQPIRGGIVELIKVCVVEEWFGQLEDLMDIFSSLHVSAKSLFFRWVEERLRAERALFASLFDETCDEETSFQTEVFGPVAEEIAAAVVHPKAVVRRKLRFLERNKLFFFN